MIEENAAADSDVPLDHHAARIAILGASNPYCIGLIKAMLHMSNKLRGCHFVLMDTDEEELELIYTLGTKLFQHADVALTLERTTSREEALADTDFVLTAFHTGGIEAQRLDEKIPLRYGLIGQKMLGAGGFFSALRTVPLIASIAVEMEKVIPRAFLLNYTSPCNIVTEAVAHVSGIRTIGLCDSTFMKFRKSLGSPASAQFPASGSIRAPSASIRATGPRQSGGMASMYYRRLFPGVKISSTLNQK